MKWLNDEAIVNFDIHMAHNLSNYRYILKVDLEYPEKLHLHISYPLPPEKKMFITDGTTNDITKSYKMDLE